MYSYLNPKQISVFLNSVLYKIYPINVYIEIYSNKLDTMIFCFFFNLLYYYNYLYEYITYN